MKKGKPRLVPVMFNHDMRWFVIVRQLTHLFHVECVTTSVN